MVLHRVITSNMIFFGLFGSHFDCKLPIGGFEHLDKFWENIVV